MSTAHFAQTTDFAFVNELLTFGEDYAPQSGDTVEFDDLETTSGTPFPGKSARVVSRSAESIVLEAAPAAHSSRRRGFRGWSGR